jgi:tRNA (cmo5U34)-methyltransferase
VPQFSDFDPDTYLESMHVEVPDYGELQERTVAATAAVQADAILELGAGSGETTRRLRAAHPDARIVGIDRSEAMLSRAREAVPDAELLVSSLEGGLPKGPFDLVVTALAVHHLTRADKRDLFERVARSLRPAGLFVLADVVVPADPADAVTPLEDGFDLPDTLDDQVGWLRAAGFDPDVVWAKRDLALVAARR